MRILILSDQFPPRDQGGAGLIAALEAKGLRARGHNVEAVSINHAERTYLIDDVRVESYWTPQIKSLRKYFAIWGPFVAGKVGEKIRRFRPDIVHFHNVHLGLSYRAVQVARQMCAHTFVTLHDMMSVHWGKVPGDVNRIPETRLSRRIKGTLQEVRTIGISKAQIRALEQNGVQVNHQLYNGLELEPHIPRSSETESVRRRYGLTRDTPYFLFCGRISRAKGIEAILAAIRSSRGHLLVVGQTGHSDSKVTYVPPVPYREIGNYYRLARAVVTPSLYLDTFPTVNLEACQWKKPVIGTCWGGTPELIQDGQGGYIVRPDNREKLTSRINILADSRAKAEQMGRAAHARFASSFTLDHHLDRLLEIYS